MQKKWWHGKIAYQIYPKSFKDSNGDGIGDIDGIISKLPYLHKLGIEILWISPMYVSPFVDQGYDIADYENIDPVFGTNEKLDILIKKAKDLNIDIVMDLVVNHCSSEHPWFKEALKDKNSKYRDYFYFVKGKDDGTPPDNLRSYFGGSVWEKVEGEDNTYYLHYFAKEQPDLNWNNVEVREQIYAMINRWFERGIAGFRVDAIMNIAKDLSFPGLPADREDGSAFCLKMTEKLASKANIFLQEMKQKTFALHDKFSVGEAFGVGFSLYKDFIGDNGCFDTIFDFKPRELTEGEANVYDRKAVTFTQFRDATYKSQNAALNAGFLAPVFENHDEPRGISYYLPSKFENQDGAKAFATFLLPLRGIPFIYQGQELGLKNQEFNSIDEIDDLYTHDVYKECLKGGLTPSDALKVAARETRDNARAPMPWDDSVNAGFSTGKPWLKPYVYALKNNVKLQEDDANSTLNYYRKLIALRKDENYKECFTYGDFKSYETPNLTGIYSRELGSTKIVVAVNFSDEPLSLNIDNDYKVLIETKKDSILKDRQLLASGCAVILQVK